MPESWDDVRSEVRAVLLDTGGLVRAVTFRAAPDVLSQVMLAVHREGIGVCGVYPRDVAATKVEQVIAFSKQHQHPLQCVMEETE